MQEKTGTGGGDSPAGKPDGAVGVCLARREKLVVLFRAGGMGFKTLMHVLDTEFKIDGTSRTTLSSDYQRGMLKVLLNAKDHGLWTVFPNL